MSIQIGCEICSMQFWEVDELEKHLANHQNETSIVWSMDSVDGGAIKKTHEESMET